MRAEIAMCAAEQRRNAIATHRLGADEAALERLHLVRDLRDAIAARAIDVHHQPKPDLRTAPSLRRRGGARAGAAWRPPPAGRDRA